MKAWEQFLTLQEIEMGKATVQKWLRNLKISRFDAQNLFLEAQDPFQAIWFEEQIRKKIKGGIPFNGKFIKVHLNVAKNQKLNKTFRKKQNEPQELDTFKLNFDSLDPSFHFDSFFPTKGSLLPLKVLYELTGYQSKGGSLNPANVHHSPYNPLFLYGKAGSGKTHLLMAVAFALRRQGLNATYVKADTFADHVVSAIRAGEMRLFREAYRSSDVLLLDDVDILARKSATQEEFFHTFNTLHLAGKLIILTANKPPRDLDHIEKRLISRFEWGLSLPLELPSKEEMRVILEGKCALLDIHLSPKVADFFLTTFKSGPKALIRALEAFSLRTHMNEDKSLAKQASLYPQALESLIKDLIDDEEKSVLTAEIILKAVAEHFGIRIDDLKGPSQARESTLPRQVAIYFLRSKLSLPYMKIGDLLSRDHSTIMTSFRRIQKGLDSEDEKIAPLVRDIEKGLI
ncbi:DnaA ATPase domain-containing protein [Criblamydia sequanensis]|uniref:Chromosomal replication initiator protein DnaA n=1 Tax=Candidatus Criblamydia sequanensis CRIB-18 TaxID=1437425 RepID=A0A090CZ04_9BACT|nr:DnaA/Hda family protein [Criblamydia sequanensis]CDR34062.1 Chromosomal replication initiator protein DnaA [Criblamydia sequanensis CRIB-18]